MLAVWRTTLTTLQSLDVVSGPPWQLTVKGRETLEVGYSLASSTLVLGRAAPDMLEEASTWQVLLELVAEA